tara:strand:- start:436 stop:690 length:255 start_codon:yes stop_codon:yes gene_type:complete
MAWEARNGDGTLYQNDRKEGNQPDYGGWVLAHRDIAAGEKLNLAGWWKGGADGRAKFLSLKMSDVRGRPDEAAPPQQPDDPVPF